MKITLYRTATCPKCKVLEQKMKNKGIEFTECMDVETLSAMGIMSVPVLSVDGELLNFTQANEWINNQEG